MSDESYKTKITDHKIHLLKLVGDDDHAVANCSVVINDCICISGLKIIQLNGRYSIKWPTNPYYGGSRHLAFPTQKMFREYVEDALLSAYIRIIGNAKIKALMEEIGTLKEQRIKAINEGKEDLAHAYGKAITHINAIIQDT